MPVEYADWRTGPPPRECTSCGATKAGCKNRLGFSGRPCCPDCAHPTESEADDARQ